MSTSSILVIALGIVILLLIVVVVNILALNKWKHSSQESNVPKSENLPHTIRTEFLNENSKQENPIHEEQKTLPESRWWIEKEELLYNQESLKQVLTELDQQLPVLGWVVYDHAEFACANTKYDQNFLHSVETYIHALTQLEQELH